jgi:hypothetical protein
MKENRTALKILKAYLEELRLAPPPKIPFTKVSLLSPLLFLSESQEEPVELEFVAPPVPPSSVRGRGGERQKRLQLKVLCQEELEPAGALPNGM